MKDTLLVTFRKDVTVEYDTVKETIMIRWPGKVLKVPIVSPGFKALIQTLHSQGESGG